MDENLFTMIRPCVLEDGRKGFFHGFCDNNDKAVIEFEDGELHKAYVWKVKFLDDKVKRYFSTYSE